MEIPLNFFGRCKRGFKAFVIALRRRPAGASPRLGTRTLRAIFNAAGEVDRFVPAPGAPLEHATIRRIARPPIVRINPAWIAIGLAWSIAAAFVAIVNAWAAT